MNINSRNLNPLVLFVAALVFLTILAGAGGMWSVTSAQGTVPPPPPTSRPPSPPPPSPSSNQTNVPPIQLRPPAALPTPDLVCFDALAFHSARDGNLEIYIMNGDGSGLSRLTYASPVDEHPAPSPDGRLIAFDSTRDPPNSHIFVMNVDGTNVRRLTAGNFIERTPHWSPDGQRIAFESNRDGSFQIYTLNYDGSDIRQLTRGLNENTQPQWSKDNTRIAFVSSRDGHSEIYVMSATDGANQTRLTNTPGNKNSSHPTWSRDSRRLAFESDRTGNYEIYVMNANGSDQKQITKTDSPPPAKSNRFPYWVPSCDDRITFSSNREDPDLRIWVTNPDGSNQLRLRYERPGLLNNPNAPDEHAAWSGAPILPLNNAPATPVGSTAPSAIELSAQPSVTPQLAVAPANATPEQNANATNSNPVSNSDPGLWGWLIALWARLTGK